MVILINPLPHHFLLNCYSSYPPIPSINPSTIPQSTGPMYSLINCFILQLLSLLQPPRVGSVRGRWTQQLYSILFSREWSYLMGFQQFANSLFLHHLSKPKIVVRSIYCNNLLQNQTNHLQIYSFFTSERV